MTALAVVDPALTDLCGLDGCAHAEGNHLICGCTECPCAFFVLECEHCGAQYSTPWRLALHRLLRPTYCRAAEQKAVRQTRSAGV